MTVSTALADLPPATLRAQLAAAGTVPEAAIWTPLPGGRSSRVWRVAWPGHDLVCKLAGPRPASRIFPEDLAVERLCLRHLAGSGLAPQSLASDTELPSQTLIYHHVAGPAPSGGDDDAIAQALGRLHGMPPPPGLRRRVGDLAAETAVLVAGLPPARQRMLPALPAGGDPGPAVFLHGDPVAANMIAASGGLVLIDWSCAAVGPAVLDLAVALSPAMQRLYGAAPDRDRLLGAYPDAATVSRYHRLARLLHHRLAAYCLWRADRGEPDYLDAAAAEIAGLDQL